MAYISTEDVRTIRQNLKREFPEIRFSVRCKDHMGVNVSIMKSPYDFSEVGESHNVNHYHLDRYEEHGDLFKRIMAVVNAKNWDKSDPQTDYFDVGFYPHLEIGQWDRPYVREEVSQ